MKSFLPSHTYVASPAAVKFVGAEPVLVECGYDNMMDPNHIEQAITDKTKAIIPVQLNGRTCDMDEIDRIAENNDKINFTEITPTKNKDYKVILARAILNTPKVKTDAE
jgi:histidinol-phosphate/aromatic aminotransferase/cobyric acid decarboxylase-like protein